MPRFPDTPAMRLGLALAAAAAAALAAALAFDTFEREPAAASGAARPPRVLDRVLVRAPATSAPLDAAGRDEAPTDAVPVGTPPGGDALPQPAPMRGAAVVMVPPERPVAPPVRRTSERPGPTPRPADARPPADAPDAGPARRLNRQGIALIDAGRPDEAIAPLERAASLQPRDAEILGNLGYAYLLVGEYDAARRHLARALDVAPARSVTWLNLGQTYAELGQRERAVDAVLTGYRHSARKASVHAALLAAATGTRHSPRWREAAGLALARIGNG